MNITVNPVNDAPSFVKGNNVTICENSAAQTVNSWATSISAGPSNESSQVVNFLVSNDNNSLFTVQPAISASGTMIYTPANGKSGIATVTGGTVLPVTTTLTTNTTRVCQFNLKVFNRWGNKVYESDHYKNDWDGVSNVGILISKQLPA